MNAVLGLVTSVSQLFLMFSEKKKKNDSGQFKHIVEFHCFKGEAGWERRPCQGPGSKRSLAVPLGSTYLLSLAAL